MQPLKQGRRPKDKIDHDNIPPADPAFRGLVGGMISELAVDPTRGDEMAMIFGPLVMHRTGDHFRKFAGVLLAFMIERAPSEVLNELFSRILAMKKNAEAADAGDYGRNAVALIAWRDFVKENGFSPKKRRLKKFILENPRKYHNMPGAGDGAGWTRMWKGSGLKDMEG